MTNQPLRVSEVFVPGTRPKYTYNPREELRLEEELRDYIEEKGEVLAVSGPTKTGKTVLLRRVLQNPVWVDAQGIHDVDDLWRSIGDAATVFTDLEFESSTEATAEGQAEGGAGAFGLNFKTTASLSNADSNGQRHAVSRPISSAASEALVHSARPLVIDDFHFIDRRVQGDILRALKPLILDEVPVVLALISHKARGLEAPVPDMTSRVRHLPINSWSKAELRVIANKGFEALNVTDPGGNITNTLADNSYESPHLMQKFCREICKANGIRERQQHPTALEEPLDWSEFYKSLAEGVSGDWFGKLLRGPQERGSKRNTWTTKSGHKLDGYGITLMAIASTGPTMDLTKDQIKLAVESLTANSGPAANQTTRVLQRMSSIAKSRAEDPRPSEDELDSGQDHGIVNDIQPVLEYIDDGPNSTLHIADPFFAFYIRWLGADVVTKNSYTESSDETIIEDKN